MPKNKNGEPSPAPIVSISKLQVSPTNARERTERSASAIENSLRSYGAGRSILLDENLQILAGHGVVEQAGQIGIERVRLVESDGDELVAVVRRGLTTEQKAGIRIADNRAAELSTWNHDKLMLEGEQVDLSKFFFPEELKLIELEGKRLVQFAVAPDDFAEADENITVEHQCPKCGYKFSGGAVEPKAKHDEAAPEPEAEPVAETG